MSLHLSRWLTNLREGLIGLLYPNTCWTCACFLSDQTAHICPGCEELLTKDPHATCPRCASSIGPNLPVEDKCLHCRDQRFAFERAVRLGPYDGLLREVILRLKNSRDENLAEIIGSLWARQALPRLRELAPQIVVPVPLHWTRRYFERGFNQTEVLARCLAKALQIPCYPHGIRRLRRTPRQTFQDNAAARRANVRGAFRARAGYDLAGKTVLLVDDVLTTGATAHEAASALRTLKPARIVVAVLGAAHVK
jgi:ComF family protein